LTYVEDSRIAQATRIDLRDTRDWLLTLDQDEFVDLALTENGLRATVTARGRLALKLYHPATAAFPPPSIQPARTRTKTGGEKALIIGISTYLPPITQLPAVANDLREVAKLLGSDSGQFPAQNVTCLVDQAADWQSVLGAVKRTFQEVTPADSVFVYMAGHGAVVKDNYFFVAYDTEADKLPATGVPLTEVKAAFDASHSQRAFLWLDLCHSGGILARDLTAPRMTGLRSNGHSKSSGARAN
jgi:hypothetical protein